MGKAFESAGYEAELGKVTVSNRPDLCEYQCNGAMAGAKKYHKAPIMIAGEVADVLKTMPVFSSVEAVAPGCMTDAAPSLASEDFALYGQSVPSWFFWVGSRTPGEPAEDLHRPMFHTDDRAMRQAAQLYAAAAMITRKDQQ